jgi:hypothetical protein
VTESAASPQVIDHESPGDAGGSTAGLVAGARSRRALMGAAVVSLVFGGLYFGGWRPQRDTGSADALRAPAPTAAPASATAHAPPPAMKAMQAPASVPPSRPAAPPAAAVTDSIAAPAVQVGDTYTYETIDHNDPRLNNVVVREVTGVAAGEITMRFINAKNGYARVLTFDRDLGLISARSASGGDGSTYSPAVRYFTFPLRIGETWTATSTETSTAGKTRQHALRGRVEAVDTVSVPAGTFRAIRVVLESEVLEDSKILYGRDVSWYVPEIRRTAKSELESRDSVSGQVKTRTVVLTTYSLKP